MIIEILAWAFLAVVAAVCLFCWMEIRRARRTYLRPSKGDGA